MLGRGEESEGGGDRSQQVHRISMVRRRAGEPERRLHLYRRAHDILSVCWTVIIGVSVYAKVEYPFRKRSMRFSPPLFSLGKRDAKSRTSLTVQASWRRWQYLPAESCFVGSEVDGDGGGGDEADVAVVAAAVGAVAGEDGVGRPFGGRESCPPASNYTVDRAAAAVPASSRQRPRVKLAFVPDVRDDCDGGAGYPAWPSAGLPEGPPLPRLLAPVACFYLRARYVLDLDVASLHRTNRTLRCGAAHFSGRPARPSRGRERPAFVILESSLSTLLILLPFLPLLRTIVFYFLHDDDHSSVPYPLRFSLPITRARHSNGPTDRFSSFYPTHTHALQYERLYFPCKQRKRNSH